MKYFLLSAFLVFIIIISLTYTGFSQKRIAVMGSSSAKGYFPPASGIPRDSAWAYKIKKYYKDLGIIDTLFNIAESSTTFFEGMPSSYTPPSGFGYALPNPNLNITKAVNLIPKPDVIIINYPSNGYDYIPIPLIMSSLQTIKDSANASNIQCYITTSQPRTSFAPAERIILKVIRDSIINRFGVWAIDFFTDIVQEPDLVIKPEYNVGDNVHLTPPGHSILKNKVVEKNIFLILVAVKFADVNAATQADKIVLQWKTLFETDNQQFIIETSTDGIHFVSLTTIAGKLNSAGTQQYSFMHLNPAQGQNYYRIVAVSVQGQKEYSTIATATFKKKLPGSVAIVYANNIVNLSFIEILKKPVLVRILDVQGKLMLNKKIENISTLMYPLNLPDLPAGKYIVQVIFEDHKETGQFVKW